MGWRSERRSACSFTRAFVNSVHTCSLPGMICCKPAFLLFTQHQGGKDMERRYYVRRVNEQQCEVRERQAPDAIPEENDRIVRSDFTDPGHAHYFVDKMNQLQRRLDEQHGHWVQKAI
jgi:hypothetical protein